jgi:hypothetical protein
VGGRRKRTGANRHLVGGLPNYMAAGGNPRQMESAKKGLFNALIGIALVLGARVVAGMIVSAMAGIVG